MTIFWIILAIIIGILVIKLIKIINPYVTWKVDRDKRIFAVDVTDPNDPKLRICYFVSKLNSEYIRIQVPYYNKILVAKLIKSKSGVLNWYINYDQTEKSKSKD